MSDQGNRPPDEPTRAYTPVSGNDDDPNDATRLERPIAPYSEGRGDVPPTMLPPGYREKNSLIAPLVTVGLLCVLIGIGLGYVLFHDTSSDDDEPTTTTTSVIATTTTTEATTTTTTSSTTTTAKATTTSSTAKPTTTTSVKATTTVKPTTTTTLPIDTE